MAIFSSKPSSKDRKSSDTTAGSKPSEASADAPLAAADSNPSSASTLSLRLARHLVPYMLRAVGSPKIAFELWNGETFVGGDGQPAAHVVIRDGATLFRLLVNPDLQFGEAYSDGRLEVRGDLVGLIAELNRGLNRKPRRSRWRSLVHRLLPDGDSPSAARDDIHYHYDLGNDFYRLWLDEQLLYSCAYFARPDMTLEAAQTEKLDHICRKVQLRPGQAVVEAGCGWGAAALHMARHYGVTVKAYNISSQQIAYARRRAAAEGLQDRVEFVEEDWRNIQGRFDAFVSIGMLEHVGPKNYRRLGDVIDGCLKPDGRGLIHFIGRNAPQSLDAWTKKHIFPGAHVPAWSELGPIFEPHRFSLLDIENLRLHYAATMRHWLTRFEAATETIARMFDERFVRMWRLYLAGSQATFETGWLQLFQISFARDDDNTVPWTREHVYATANRRDERLNGAMRDGFGSPTKRETSDGDV